MDATKDIPKPGERRRTKLPDAFDGIRFEIARVVKYVQECRNDPLVAATAKRIAEEYLAQPRARSSGDGRLVLFMQAIHEWGRQRFVEVLNPHIEIIETPMRLIRRTMVPPEAEAAILEPFVRKAGEVLKPPPPKLAMSLVSSVTLVLSLVGSLKISPLRIRFGGTDGTLHYAWASAHAYGSWFDIDLHEPFGKRRKFEHLEDLEIP